MVEAPDDAAAAAGFESDEDELDDEPESDDFEPESDDFDSEDEVDAAAEVDDPLDFVVERESVR
ncbi:hypothetical protein AB0K00_31430 [Dactylosporangium sp. NPDC049525]|uniref:hypothetical protein n=1 Tax=Dactylosporangium sp. NPDC049525 TaxID=3154730 RepID=UPI003427F133